MKKAISLILALLMIFSLAACGGEPSESNTSGNGTSTAASGGSSTSGGSAKPTEVHIATETDPGTFTPYGTNKGRQNFFRNLYETLGRLTVDMDLDLCLAKSWKEVEPGVYEVEIYDYITDSDGNHMTASDVAFSFDTFSKEAADTSGISSLASWETTGDYTIRFHFDNPKAGAFPVAMESVRIITQAAWEASGDGMASRPVGTAAYVLGEYKPGEYAVLEKRADYWQTNDAERCYTSVAYEDKIYLDIISDRSTQALALMSGDLDLSQYITVSDMGKFVNDDVTAKPGYIISTGIVESRQYLMTFNCSDNSPCADLNLRRAIACCIDRPTVSKTAFGMTAMYPETVIWQYYKEYDPSLKSHYSYDIDQAKAYLADSDYVEGTPVRLLCYSDFDSDAALIMQEACRQAGINLELIQTTQAEYASLNADTTGTQFDIDLCAIPSTGFAWGALSVYNEDAYSNGLPHTYLKDAKLKELYDAMAYESSTSPENVAAFADYVDDMCYGFSLGSNQKIIVATDKVDLITRDSYGSFVAGGTRLAG